MDRLIASIRQALKDENWFAALFLALAVPDICGALEAPCSGVGDRYKAWFTRYLGKTYDPASVFPSTFEHAEYENPEFAKHLPTEIITALKAQPIDMESSFTAEDCYRLRCKCLHQGLPEKSDAERIHFTAPDGRTAIHRNIFFGHYQLSIDIFCLDISKAAEDWLRDVAANPDVEARMKDLIEIYEVTDHRLPIVRWDEGA